jgi:hypothetical protein
MSPDALPYTLSSEQYPPRLRTHAEALEVYKRVHRTEVDHTHDPGIPMLSPLGEEGMGMGPVMGIASGPVMGIGPGKPDDDMEPEATAIAEKHQVYPADLADRDRSRLALFSMARDMIGLFGRAKPPNEYRAFVDEWYRLSAGLVEGEAPARFWNWFCRHLQTVHSAPGEVWSSCVAMLDDPATSDGFCPEVKKNPKVEKLASLMRLLDAYHKGQPFYLPYSKIQEALGLRDKRLAGPLVFRLEKLDPPYLVRLDKRNAYRDGDATVYQYLGPKWVW